MTHQSKGDGFPPKDRHPLSTVLDSVSRDDDRLAICSGKERSTWSQLAACYHQQRARIQPHQGCRVGLRLTADSWGYSALAALESVNCEVFVFDAMSPRAQQLRWARELGLDVLLPASPEMGPDVMGPGRPITQPTSATDPEREGTVTILTSGTTGSPKAVRHSWPGITRPVRQLPDGGGQRWLLAFRPHLYAGLQVALQSLLNGSCLVVADPTLQPNQIADVMFQASVQYVSATPSYWRRLLMGVPHATLAGIPLKQITLGGETADQAILDQLRQIYPSTRIVHIYATTELGRCFSVTDGRAGFPASYLRRPTPDGVELKIENNQLWVRSANAMLGYDHHGPEAAFAQSGKARSSDWFPTKDVVQQRDDRVYFVGRDSDMINVGGNKVFPLAVERLIRQLPEVADVRVYGVDSSVAGQLVGCQVVAEAGYAEADVREAVMDHCRAQLDRFACPRIVELVDELPMSEAGKRIR